MLPHIRILGHLTWFANLQSFVALSYAYLCGRDVASSEYQRLKNEGKINWNDEALSILGKINGLFPTPGAFFNFNGERYKILKAETGNGMGKAGEVISDNLEIACSKNQSIKVLEIQRQGKKPQKISDFILGSQIKKGSRILDV